MPRSHQSARITDSVIDKSETAEEVDLIGGIEGIGNVPYPQIHAGFAARSLPTEARI